jgi:hypothetical protein
MVNHCSYPNEGNEHEQRHSKPFLDLNRSSSSPVQGRLQLDTVPPTRVYSIPVLEHALALTHPERKFARSKRET